MINTKENSTKSGSSMDDIVFEDRNKSYGAYQLRKNYVKNFLTAMLIAAAALILFLVLYSFALKKKKNVEVEIMQDVSLIEDVALDEKQPEPPKVEPPPPLVEQIQYLPPEIKEVVTEEVIPPSEEDLEKVKNIGAENVKGDTIEAIVEDTKESKIIDDGEDDIVYTAVEENAEFPGGRAAMMKYMQKNLVYPESAKKKELEGIVYVYFEIDKTGKIVNAKVTKGFNKECDEEALRFVKSFPDWKPAKMNGRAVRQRTSLPFKFAMPTD
jgi:protein TonB